MLTPGYPEILSVILEDVGYWNIYVTVPRNGTEPSRTTDISVVRGVVTQIDSLTFTDPFGSAMAALTFPGLTLLDSFGEGDLHWWRPGANIDIVWTFDDSNNVAGPEDVVRTELRWEGYIAGDSTSSVSAPDSAGSAQMTCKGALRKADNTLAMPQFPVRPIPYEHLIRLWLAEANLRGAGLGPLRMEWPVWWDTIYRDDPNRAAEMVPLYVSAGQKWSAMLTRDTGSKVPVLTSYIQGLLGAMHTPRGQFTLDCQRGRIPVLRHRDRVGIEATCEIDLVTPGVSADLGRDYEAKANVIYGSGVSLDKVAYSNMQFTGANGSAYYLPFAAHHSVYPFATSNAWRDPRTIVREISLQFYDGLTPEEATVEANSYLRRYSSAATMGQITLTTDPYTVVGERRVTMLRHTLRAGDSIRLLGMHGRRAGVPLHITESTYSPMTGTLQLTVDSAFRDQLTAAEVALHGRDALLISRQLQGSKFAPATADQLLPWSEKSGYAPVNCYPLFSAAVTARIPNALVFPWDPLVKAYPPKDARYKASYIRIPAADEDVLQKNWSRPVNSNAYPKHIIWLSQAGQIKLMQFMAVDANGDRMKVPFHLGIYYNESVDGTSMPLMDKLQDPTKPAGTTWKHPLFGLDYGYYPFFPGAWENVMEDGTTPPDGQQRMPTNGSGPIVYMGGYRSAAGYYPSLERPGAVPTGLLSVENPFTYDVTSQDKDWDPTSTHNSFEGAKAVGIAAVLIYCDSMWDETTRKLVPRDKDVYFIGRLFRAPSGNGE